jgi:cell wall assembly regulator SMI1
MADWNQIVDNHFARAYDADQFTLTVRAAATQSQLAATEATIGFRFPAEFHRFYETMNGFGVAPNASPQFAFDLFPVGSKN